MFCSNCGKTLKGDAATCPHCDYIVGENRFSAVSYTSAQVRTKPGEAVRLPTNYTKTVFMGKNPTMDADVDARTIYRATENTHVASYVQKSDEREPLYDSQRSEQTYEEEVYENGEADAAHTDAEYSRSTEADEGRAPTADGAAADDKGGAQREKRRAKHARTDAEKRVQEKDPSAKSKKAPEAQSVVDKELEAEMNELRAREITLDSHKGISEDVRRYMEGLHEAAEASREKELAREKAEPRPGMKKLINFKAFRFRRQEEDFDSLDPDDAEFVDEGDEFKLNELPVDEGEEEEDALAPVQDEDNEEYTYDVNAPDDGADADDAPDAVDEQGDAEDADADDLDYGLEDELAYQKRQKIQNTLKYVLAGLVVVLVLVGAIVGIAFVANKTKTAPIEGVSLGLYETGIEQMQYRVTDEYKNERLGLFDGSAVSMIAFTESISKDLDGLQQLLPETPSVNDHRFIAALSAIQTNINNCLTNDMLGVSDTTQTAVEKDAASAGRWAMVKETVEALAKANNPAQLDAIVNGEKIDVIEQTTPEPVQATPAPYATLASGSKGQEVTKLQTRLSELGYLNSEVDGDFGGKTKTAVQLFQKAVGMETTGIADAETQIALFDLNAPRYTPAS